MCTSFMQAFVFSYNLYINLGGVYMVRLRVLHILEEQQHTKYWLYKQMDLSYQNFNRMIMNETNSIRYENLDKLCAILDCSVGDLFERVEEEA